MQPKFPPLIVVDLLAEADSSQAQYQNSIIAQVNDHCLRISTFEGTYPWHEHPNTDETFVVVSGSLTIETVDARVLRLAPWQMVTIPAGVAHRTQAIGRTVNITFERLHGGTVFLDSDGELLPRGSQIVEAAQPARLGPVL